MSVLRRISFKRVTSTEGFYTPDAGEVIDGDGVFKGRIRGGSYVEAAKATGTLVFSGGVAFGEMVSIGSEIYEFTNGIESYEGNLAVDISAGTPSPAYALVALNGDIADGDTVTIIEGETSDVFEFKVSASHVVGVGNIEVDLSALYGAAAGTFTVSTTVSEGETVTIGDFTYEYDNDHVVSEGNIPVWIGTNTDKATAVTTLAHAINVNSASSVIAIADPVAGTVAVTAKVLGLEGNLIGTTTDCANGSWGATTLINGVEPTPTQIYTAWAAAAAAVTTNVVFSMSVDPYEGITYAVITCGMAGSSGNLLSLETSNPEAFGLLGSFDGGFSVYFVGGVDCSLEEAIVALVAAISGVSELVIPSIGVGENEGNLLVEAIADGSAPNAITLESTAVYAEWSTATLTGGVTSGPVYNSTAVEVIIDATNLYAKVLVGEEYVWKKVALTEI